MVSETSQNCPGEQELSAYHDGELPQERRAIVAEHLPSCAPCREVIARWTAISQLFNEAPHQRLSGIARERVRRSAMRSADSGILRLAWTMSGLAASVMVVGSLWLTHLNDNLNADTALASPPPWVGVAYARDTNQSQHEPATPAAEWYLASNSSSSDELP
jgi:anti-sigma factor RsiW